MLRAEHGRDVEPGRDQRVEAMRQVLRDRGGMREERDALAFQRAAKLGLGEQPVDSEQGHEGCLGKLRGEATGVVEVGLVRRGCASAQ